MSIFYNHVQLQIHTLYLSAGKQEEKKSTVELASFL